jgi:hypothetical protein
VCAESIAQTFGLFYAARRKVYLGRAVSGREHPYPISDYNVRMAQQDDLPALPESGPDLIVVGQCTTAANRQQDRQAAQE